MAGGQRKRNEFEIKDRRTKVTRLYLERKTQAEIAELLSISRYKVETDLKAIHKEWLTERVGNFEKAKAEELARLDQIERKAWIAFEKSEGDAVMTETVTNVKTGETTKERRTGQTGDATFLKLVLDCVEKRCKICGLYIQVEEEPATEEVQERDVRVCEIVVEGS